METEKTPRPRSMTALSAFGLSLVFILIEASAYMVLVEPLAGWLPLAATMANNVLHSLLISGIGTLLCCAAFLALRKRHRLVPLAFCYFPVYLLICVLFCFIYLDGEERRLLLEVAAVYMVPAILWSQCLGWIIHRRLRRLDQA